MDAIQLASSVVELLRVCNEIVKIVQDFRHSDEAIAELVREVEFFAEFLRGLKVALAQHRTYHYFSPDGLKKALDHADTVIFKVWAKLEPIENAGSSATRRLKWLLGRSHFQKLRIQMREHNLFLHSLLSVAYG